MPLRRISKKTNVQRRNVRIRMDNRHKAIFKKLKTNSRQFTALMSSAEIRNVLGFVKRKSKLISLEVGFDAEHIVQELGNILVERELVERKSEIAVMGKVQEDKSPPSKDLMLLREMLKGGFPPK